MSTNCTSTNKSPNERKHQQRPLRVIGAGLMRTGTMSMKTALEQLLGQPCFHMIVNWQEPKYINMWLRLFQPLKSREERRKVWDELLQGFSAAVDVPTCVFVGELAELYPDAVVILTRRDPYAWVRSVRETIVFHTEICKQPSSRTWLRQNGLQKVHKLTQFFMERLFNPRGNRPIQWDDTEDMVSRYRAWEDYVRSTVPPHRLLEIDVTQSNESTWEVLCHALQVQIPSPVKPFPYVNTRHEFLQRLLESPMLSSSEDDQEFSRHLCIKSNKRRLRNKNRRQNHETILATVLQAAKTATEKNAQTSQ